MTLIPEISADFLKKVKRKKFSKRIKKVVLLPLIVFIVVFFCTGDYGLFKIFRLRGKIDAAEKEIVHLKVKAEDYCWEIDKLKSDSNYIKLYAADKYGYARADQEIIQFLPAPSDTLH